MNCYFDHKIMIKKFVYLLSLQLCFLDYASILLNYGFFLWLECSITFCDLTDNNILLIGSCLDDWVVCINLSIFYILSLLAKGQD